jgi:hypothetical protein
VNTGEAIDREACNEHFVLAADGSVQRYERSPRRGRRRRFHRSRVRVEENRDDIQRWQQWRAVKPPKKQTVRDMDFVSARVGFLLDLRGRLWKTMNAGRKWVQVDTAGASGSLIEFADARSGYMTLGTGYALRPLAGMLLRTADGGLTWHPQLLNRDVVRAVEAAGRTDYALSGEPALLATTSRGDAGAPQKLSIRTKTRVLRKPARISVSGRLTPADGGETVVVARYLGGRWQQQTALVASNGSFATRWTVGGTAVFVAQVLGDADHAGTGSRPLTVTLKAKKKVEKRS